MTNVTLDTLVEDFSFLTEWDDRYGYVLDLGRGLAPLSEDERTDQTKVKGCVSQVWLVTEHRADGRLEFRGDSDSVIVKGLIAVLLIVFSGRTPAEILATDPEPILAKLGLAENLTPQRANGLRAMIERIQRDAKAAQDTA